ncbi:DUF5996 family protein [Cellulomonas marina]|uniref:Ava_C0101 and related proteins n=1 Tax=Cellulomonas marina TaxID=988821 RepID=A0A1I1AM47_9CELL|nr:DUF5996 family protein [Cellulomonas marina]GIG30447.1 hypothetical protein Cma02nite_30470 [Cellulomonas marina]SFB39099.1 hypothetical protein SAMN05421867_12019 [Cellulomonas marina]
MSDATTFDPWPALPVAAWQDTRDTLHLWTQVVGKVRMALSPAVNHWWHVPLYVDARGLTTSLMPTGGAGVEIVLDLTAHELLVLTTRGERRRMALEPRSVADFTAELLSHLRELGVDAPIHPVPVEVEVAIPFAEDTKHASYDAEAVHRFWTSLVSAHRVLSTFRGAFRGKASPVHFFWGAFDLAVTRFSGRGAPPHPGGVPHCPDHVMLEAYSDEVSSCGYWPGGADEGAFYAYAYPEPDGYRTSAVVPAQARFDAGLGEFVLPYADVRRADDPDAYLLSFLEATHTAAARTGAWPGAS